jgi:hypothetical protein
MAVCHNPILLLHATFLQSSQSGYNICRRQAVEATLTADPGWLHAVYSGLSLAPCWHNPAQLERGIYCKG